MEYRDKLREIGITLEKSGKQICPRCSASRKNKQDKCLSVTLGNEAVLYKCHNCDWSGAVYYRDKYEVNKHFTRPKTPAVKKEKQALYDYFQKRGISKAVLDEYGIDINPQNEIILPYYKNGELVNVKYRKNLGNGKKTFRQEKDTEKTLFVIVQEKGGPELIWVEGEMDVLAFAEQGIRAVSVPNGAAEKNLECIENCYDFIDKFHVHVIAVDNDIAGDNLKTTLLKRLGTVGCRVVNWKQYKDANEALLAGEKLSDFIDSAEDIAPDGVVTFLDYYDEIYKYNYEKDLEYYSTGWDKIDRLIRLRTGYLMVITGYPSRGKSTFVDNLAMNLSKRYGLKHLIASFESPIETHYNQLAEMYLQMPIYKILQEGKIFGEVLEFICSHFYRFTIDRTWTIDEICERTELADRKYGIKTLIIDPYNRLNNKFTNNREDLYIGSILSQLEMLAKKLDILVIFVAHPKKPDGDKMPNLYSISGSSDWYNMADYGIIIHRDRMPNDELSNEPTVFVEKVKNHFLGKTSGGSENLYYNSNLRILQNKRGENGLA